MFQNRPEIGPKSSKMAPGPSRKRSNWLPGAFEVRVFGPSGPLVRFWAIFDQFWTISGGVLGPRIVPKSIKIAPGRRLIFDAFSDLDFHRFFVHFGLQNELQNRRFFDSGSQSPTLQKPCFSLGFNRFSEVRSSRNPWKNNRKTKFFCMRFGPRFGTVFG